VVLFCGLNAHFLRFKNSRNGSLLIIAYFRWKNKRSASRFGSRSIAWSTHYRTI
jgi:hypothetical protein